MNNDKKTTKWNINLRKKTETINKKEPFLISSTFQQPLLQELPSSTQNTNNPLNTTSSISIENFNFGSIGNAFPPNNFNVDSISNAFKPNELTPHNIFNDSNQKSSYEKILKENHGNFTKIENAEPDTYPGQHNNVDSSGFYSLMVYNGNTYLNGFNCNNEGCDMSGVDIYVNWINCKSGDCDMSKVDITDDLNNTSVNTPGLVYFRNGGDTMIDASTMNLKGVTFGGKSLTNYLKSKKNNNLTTTYNNSTIKGEKSLNLPTLTTPINSKSFDITTQSYYTPANSKPNNNDSIVNLFDAPSTVRTNPFTSNTMNIKVGDSEEGMTNSNTEGVVKLNINGSNPKQTFKNFISWWKYTFAPFIREYNPIALINVTIIFFFNVFIELFKGNYQVSSYISILIYYYIFIGYLICIFITYNLFYSFFLKEKPSSDKVNLNNTEPGNLNFFLSLSNTILSNIPPLGFVFGLRYIINQIPDFLIIALKWMKLDTQDSYKIIFIFLFLFSFYFIIRLSIMFYYAFCNSFRFGNDDSGNTDTFTNNITIFLVIYIIFTTIYYYNTYSNGTPIPPIIIYTIPYFIFIILFLIIKIIISISLVWITVFLLCIYVFFVTIVPVQGFTIIHDVHNFFNTLNTTSNCENDNNDNNDNNCNKSSLFSKIIKFVINFIYKNIFQIGLILIFTFQLIDHCYSINNEYINFKSMLIIICLLFIFLGIVLILFTKLQELALNVMVMSLNISFYIIIPIIIIIGLIRKESVYEVSNDVNQEQLNKVINTF